MAVDEDALLLKVSLKTELIFKQLYYLDIPVMRMLKSLEKLSFLEQCTVIDARFGGYVYRRGEAVNGAYWLLRGEVKIFKRNKEREVEISTIEANRMFGIFCMKYEK